MSKTEVTSGAARQRFEDLYEELRKRICLLVYPPNMRLREEALAAEFGVSRTPLRRVLVRLESEGLLTSKHGVGTIVTDVDFKELKQAYELRMELAELIGRLSPVPVERIDLGIFECFLARGRALQLSPDFDEFSQLNMDYSQAVFALTDNAPLRELSERLYYQTSRIWIKSIPQMGLAEEAALFYREIESVYQALAVGDLSAVGYIRRTHISMSYTRLWRFEFKESV